MTKESYVKPEAKSETLEAEALLNQGSPIGNNGGPCDGDICDC
jgi:hypothetical protein